MKLVAFSLILSFKVDEDDEAKADLAEIVSNVIEYSTAREAIETGLDGADILVEDVILSVEEQIVGQAKTIVGGVS